MALYIDPKALLFCLYPIRVSERSSLPWGFSSPLEGLEATGAVPRDGTRPCLSSFCVVICTYSLHVIRPRITSESRYNVINPRTKLKNGTISWTKHVARNFLGRDWGMGTLNYCNFSYS